MHQCAEAVDQPAWEKRLWAAARRAASARAWVRRRGEALLAGEVEEQGREARGQVVHLERGRRVRGGPDEEDLFEEFFGEVDDAGEVERHLAGFDAVEEQARGEAEGGAGGGHFEAGAQGREARVAGGAGLAGDGEAAGADQAGEVFVGGLARHACSTGDLGAGDGG